MSTQNTDITEELKPLEGELVRVTNVPILNTSSENVFECFEARVEQLQKTVVNFVNAHCCNVAWHDDDYADALNQSDYLLPDGSGMRIAMSLQGAAMVENLNGTDLFPKLCDFAAQKNFSIYFLGGMDGVAEKAALNMISEFPSLRVVGVRGGYFSKVDEQSIIDDINAASPDFLLVGMGVPRQELWIRNNAEKLNATVLMGVGALFDFYSNKVPRAPRIFREKGIEWIWRLGIEPRRMWKRYILGNPLFLIRILLTNRRVRTSIRRSAKQKLFSAKTRQYFWWLKTTATPFLKRLFDVSVSSLLLIIFFPAFLLTALAVRVQSPGPVFFSQSRVGKRGKKFRFWKFRSMYVDAEARKAALTELNEMQGGVLFKMKDDPRITRVGRFIRRYSIDELPQLWNVLIGEMSLVGPRPALVSETQSYSINDRTRLLGKPGITCIWQVSGRSDIPFNEQVKMDSDYLQKATVSEDVKILVKTIPAVISGRGAY